MEGVDASSAGDFTSGRFDPGFNNELTAFMINPFIKYKGLEFFGMVETVKGKNRSETSKRSALQLGSELLYRFGANENFYVGGRYNKVDADLVTGEDVTLERFNLGGGWFMTNNIIVKLEYVNQKYKGFNTDNILHNGK